MPLRLLNTETQDEASFVESAQMGHNVTEYLKKSGSKGKRTRKKTAAKTNTDEWGVPSEHVGHRIQWPMTTAVAKELLGAETRRQETRLLKRGRS